jgi:hypothetical protein
MTDGRYYWIFIAIAAVPPTAICALSYSTLANSGIILNFISNLSYPLVSLYLVLTTFSLFCYFALKLDDKNRAGPLIGLIGAIELLSFVLTYLAGPIVIGSVPPILLPLISFFPFVFMIVLGSIIVQMAPPGLPSSSQHVQNDPPIDPMD